MKAELVMLNVAERTLNAWIGLGRFVLQRYYEKWESKLSPAALSTKPIFMSRTIEGISVSRL
jgi:hypothetical protein